MEISESMMNTFIGGFLVILGIIFTQIFQLYKDYRAKKDREKEIFLAFFSEIKYLLSEIPEIIPSAQKAIKTMKDKPLLEYISEYPLDLSIYYNFVKELGKLKLEILISVTTFYNNLIKAKSLIDNERKLCWDTREKDPKFYDIRQDCITHLEEAIKYLEKTKKDGSVVIKIIEKNYSLNESC